MTNRSPFVGYFKQAYALLGGDWLLVGQDGRLWQATLVGESPQWATEPATAPPAPEPSPVVKRGRGRPRKARLWQKGDPVYESKAIDQKLVDDSKVYPVSSTDQTFKNCQYCKRELPTEVLPLHEENCRAAAIGPYTHVAQPGKDSQ